MAKRRSRAGGEGSLYQDQSTGRWVAAITIGTDANGRQIRRRATAARKADAAAKLRELQRQKGLTPAAAGSARTLGAYLTGWLADIKASRAAATYDSYRHAVEGHIVPHLGSVSIERLTPLHVQRWLTALENVGGRARQNAFKVLRRALNVAVKLQVISSNPTDGFEAPRHQREPINPFTADEAAAIIESFEGSPWRLYVVLGFGAGLRQGEILGLQWGDLAGDMLHVRRQQTEISGTLAIGEPKSQSGRRSVPVPESIVTAWTVARAEALSAGRAGSCDSVFVGPRGGAMRRSNFRARQWVPTLQALGLEYRSPHQMRHTYATLALAAGVPVTVVSRALGHYQTSTTLNVYGHAMPDGVEQLREVAGRLLG